MTEQRRSVLVTGCAGFIGMHVAARLLARGDRVVGVDNLNDYYDPALKQARLKRLQREPSFLHYTADVADRVTISKIFEEECPNAVVHLAAQAGVRYSLENPHAYADSNLIGFVNMLEACRHGHVAHLVYASSSSVYGGNARLPFSEHDNVDHPVSLYAATKKANELMAHSYSHLFRLPTTGLRFFTVYGPWGRPDMALFLFTSAILDGRPIDVFNRGRMIRDFTFIDDIAQSVVMTLDKPATPAEAFDPLSPDPATSNAPYRIFNIGNHDPVELMAYVRTLEEVLGRRAEIRYREMQAGDVPATNADNTDLATWIGFKPGTSVREGIGRFVSWYREYYRK